MKLKPQSADGMNSRVISVRKGMPEHLHIGDVVAALNGESVLGLSHQVITNRTRWKHVLLEHLTISLHLRKSWID